MHPSLKEILGPCHSPLTKVKPVIQGWHGAQCPTQTWRGGWTKIQNLYISGNHTGHTRVSDIVVVRSQDASSLSLSSYNNVVNVDNHPTHTSKWERRRVRRTTKQLQGLKIQQTVSKCISENFKQRLEADEVRVRSNPSQPVPTNKQQQAAVTM